MGSGDTSREAHEEIYSVSDRSARFIKKGGRQTVFGYKIQLGRSANGFITSVLVPEGNAADSELLLLMVLDHLQRTGVIPNLVSTDDAYASAKGRNDVIKLGINYVSISGSKGKKLIPEEDWTSEIYSQARSDRSAVESLMFATKCVLRAKLDRQFESDWTVNTTYLDSKYEYKLDSFSGFVIGVQLWS